MEAQISTYEQQMAYIMKLDEDVRWSTAARKRPDNDTEASKISDEDEEDYSEGWFTQEKE